MRGYKETLKNLNSAQRRAVETIEGPVLVIAGPGTGKTQILTTRAAYILDETDSLPQNILCLTFTDSAARTMCERLSDMIGQAAYNITISTYHAFGSELIRRFPEYFTEQYDMEPIDDLGSDHILRQIIKGLPYSNPLKYADAYIGDLKGLISESKRALLLPEDLRRVAKDNLEFIQKASPLVAECLNGMTRVDKKTLTLFENIKNAVSKDYKTSKPIDLSAMFLSSLEESLDKVQNSGKTKALTEWKYKWLAKDSNNKFVISGAGANQKLLAAANVYQSYLKELKQQKLFDYDDMILRAVNALQTNNDLRYSLQERYLYIMLDEFQDTNAAQLRLVELLTSNPASEGRPNVLAVGDDDQAIYAFQGADYSNMLKFKDMYKDVVAIPLTENYRSHPDILHTARGIAEQIEERLHHHFPEIEKTLTAASKDIPKKATVQRLEAVSDVAQFAWVATRIQDLIKQGTEPSEIAVLGPKHKYLEPLVPFLQAKNLPVRYEKRENILDSRPINQLVIMSDLVMNLADGHIKRADELWPQVLSFDFWQLPTSLIWRLSWQSADSGTDWTTTMLDNPDLKHIALFFIRLSQLAKTETLETLLDYLVGASALDLKESKEFLCPYYGHYFGDIKLESEKLDGITKAWDPLSDLIVLRAKLRLYKKDENTPLNLGDLLQFVQAHKEADIKVLNTSPYASATDAVQVMTAYKAKGMEFKVVFILATNDEAWGDSAKGASSAISLPLNLQHIRYMRTSADERLRLFYVAVTRAKSELYLLSYTKDYAGKVLNRLRYLNETLDQQGNVLSPLLPENVQTILSTDNDQEPETQLSSYWQQRHHDHIVNSEVQALLSDRLQRFQLSPTHVCNFIDLQNGGPQSFLMRTILRFPEAPNANMQYGQAIHETLEWLHIVASQKGVNPSKNEVEKTFIGRLKQKRLSQNDNELLTQRGLDSLKVYLAQQQNDLGKKIVTERNFKHEGVFVGKAHLSGKIDKLIIDDQAKTITIVDYKTGKSHRAWTRDISLHKYRLQLYLYKALVEGSRTFSNYKVTNAYLEFVEPDEIGKINRLNLSLDESQYQHALLLAQSIWQSIKKLELPNVADYRQDLSGIEMFEADLLNSWSG